MPELSSVALPHAGQLYFSKSANSRFQHNIKCMHNFPVCISLNNMHQQRISNQPRSCFSTATSIGWRRLGSGTDIFLHPLKIFHLSNAITFLICYEDSFSTFLLKCVLLFLSLCILRLKIFFCHSQLLINISLWIFQLLKPFSSQVSEKQL